MPARGNFWQHLAIVRFYKRIIDWRKKSRLGPVQTSKGDGFIQWKQCRAEAPPENIVDQLPDLTDALATYRKNLNELIDRSNAYGATTIFLTQPTIWSDRMGPDEVGHLFAGGIGPNAEWCKVKKYYSPRALAEGMNRFNQVLLDVCQARDQYCIDLAAQVPKKSKYFYDEMHVSDAGADLFSDIVSRGILDFKRRNGGHFRPEKLQGLN